MQLFQGGSVHTFLKIDPRTKLFLLLVVNIIMINGSTAGAAAIYKPILACLPFVLLLTGKRIVAAFVYGIIFAMAWVTDQYLSGYLSGGINIVIALVSGLSTRWLPCGMMGYYLMATTRVSEFVAGMEKMHVSQKIVIPLSVMFRFFPTVSEESGAINNAMRMRGIRVGGGKGGVIAIFEYRIIPLIMSMVKIGDELSAAALTRGLGGEVKRTNFCSIGFGMWDILMFLLGTVFIALYFLL